MAMVILIEQSESELREEILLTSPHGTKQGRVFMCPIGSEQNAALNGAPILARAGWQGSELVIETWLPMGERQAHFCDYWSLSSDGQTCIMEHRNDDLHGQRTVLERVS